MPSRVTVNLFESHAPASRLSVEGPFHIARPDIHVPSGKYIFEADGGIIHLRNVGKTHAYSVDSQLFILDSTNGIRMQYSTSQTRKYGGVVRVARDEKILRVTNVIPTFDYVQSVVGSEGFSGYPLESAKAQAVLTMTRVYKSRPNEVVGDSTQEESYFGMDYCSPLTKQAVTEVWGQWLTYKQQPIQIFYHSTCAGGTSDGARVFGSGASNMPYLHCVPCKYCAASMFWKPIVKLIPRKNFEKEFGDLPTVDQTDCADRPVALTLHKNGKRIDESGYQFWMKLGQKFGWDKAPGLRFKLRAKGDNVEVESTGAGHGVGMCQWGAAGMAKQGKTYDQILRYYFPGTTLQR
ncbi:MAG TPA: SpoIID/LytB domain-containing protein [Drouetiella sp.]